MALKSGLYAKVRPLWYSSSVELIGIYSGHEEERRFALSYASCAPSAGHLGRKCTCGNVGVGARAYRLGFCPAQDDCDVQEHRGGMPILACTMFSLYKPYICHTFGTPCQFHGQNLLRCSVCAHSKLGHRGWLVLRCVCGLSPRRVP